MTAPEPQTPAAAYSHLEYLLDDGILTIALNRPEHLNTVGPAMRDELIDAFATADRDPDVRVIVVTGRGKAFCAGADVSGGTDTFCAKAAGWGPVEDFRDGGGQITLQIFASTKPVIGAVNGVAAGLGATMLLPMDILLAADTARIGFVFSRRGLVPEACATWFLPRRVGIGTAAEWMYTGRVMPASDALDAGLFTRVLPAADLLPAAYALAREIADNAAPVAVGLIRQMIWRLCGAEHPMAAHRVDSAMNHALGQGPDVAEGIRAFLEKRAPEFPGHMPGGAPAAFPWWTEPDFIPVLPSTPPSQNPGSPS